MLKDILSISGKPGLFKLISKGKNLFIAESLIDQKRVPVYSRDKVVSLGDITMYSNEGDVRLPQILNSIKQKEEGKPISFSPSISVEELKTYFSQVFPDFDKDRVYPSDIRKVMNWYNLLIKSGLTDFDEEVEQVSEESKINENENICESNVEKNVEKEDTNVDKYVENENSDEIQFK